ncbi:MAG: hypothetical protein V4662_08560 [Verrucomicrobiota bacterium]
MRRGWTIAELLVSVSLLGVLMLLLSATLDATQRSLLTAREQSDTARVLADVRQSLTQDLSRATLATYWRHAESEAAPVLESDLHFVCGPSEMLLAGVGGVSSDAVFFQRPAAEGGLAEVLQACGFFIRYGGDERWTPGYVPVSEARQRFRLHRFHQSAAELPLFQAQSTSLGTPRLKDARTRQDLYAWFTTPLRFPAALAAHSTIVAENVVALFISTPQPDLNGHDSRRHQWDSTPSALPYRHRLPARLEVRLLLVDEAAWARLPASRAQSLATRLMQLIPVARRRGSSPRQMEPLTEVLQSHGVPFHSTVLSVPLRE